MSSRGVLRHLTSTARTAVAPENSNQNMSQNQRSRSSRGHGISVRPSAGSAYPSPPSPENNGSDPNNRFGWNKDDMPGGRKLWCRLVFAFVAVSLLGAMFVTLGAVFFNVSRRMAMEDSMSLPLVWCIIGIVSGSLMILGSIILGKLIISDKWRKNQQPTYPSMAPPRAHFICRRRGTNEEGEVHLELPPPYEESAPENPPTIYNISGNSVTNSLPSDPPPEYTPSDLVPVVHPGNAQSVEGSTNTESNVQQTFPLVRLPQYEDVIGDPPGVDEDVDINRQTGSNTAESRSQEGNASSPIN